MYLNIWVLFVTLCFVQLPGAQQSRTKQLPAQLQGTGIEGIMKMPDGSVISGASVTVTNKQTGRSFSATTDQNGKFSFPDLPPGKYKVVVDSKGFFPIKFDDVGVSPGFMTLLNGEPTTDSIVGKIKGKVTNDQDDRAIHKAEVTIKQLSPEKKLDPIKTDSDGKYERPGLLPTKYKVRAEAPGFIASEKTVTLGKREVKEVDFSLKPH